MKDLKAEGLMIDPPSGWRYGFPKIIPKEHQHRTLDWLVENNYPKHIIDELGDHFVIRYWNVEEE